MKPDLSDAAFTRYKEKEAENIRKLPLVSDFSALMIKGPGVLKIEKLISKSGEGSVLVETPSSLAAKNPINRSYASAELIRPLDGENLTDFNRFSVWVYVDAPGFYSVFVGCTIYNDGENIMPTPGRFEGQHFETVYPNKWHQIVWEIPDLYRDKVDGFSVNIMLTGSPKGASDTLKMHVENMQLDKVSVENTRGFDLRKNAIAYDHSGYKLGSKKQALVQNVSNTSFELLNVVNQLFLKGKA